MLTVDYAVAQLLFAQAVPFQAHSIAKFAAVFSLLKWHYASAYWLHGLSGIHPYDVGVPFTSTTSTVHVPKYV